MNKRVSALVILFAVAVMIVIAGGLWYRHGALQPSAPAATDTNQINVQLSNAQNWAVYQDQQNGFELKYPSHWKYWHVTSSYGGVPVSAIYFGPSETSTEGINIEIVAAQSDATNTKSFFSLIGLDARNLQERAIVASGTVGDYYLNVPGFSDYNEALFLHNGVYYGVQNWTDDATYKAIIATFFFAR